MAVVVPVEAAAVEAGAVAVSAVTVAVEMVAVGKAVWVVLAFLLPLIHLPPSLA